MNSRRQFVLEGLKQAGLVLLLLLFLGLLTWLLMYGSVSWFGMGSRSGIFDILRLVGALIVWFVVSVLCGPVPTLLTCLDVSN